MMTRLSRFCLASAAAFGVSGTAQLGGCAAQRAPARPAPVNHIVFIKLHDAEAAEALLADADETLASIPAVSAYAAGPHIDTGRETVIHDYDVGFYIGFDSLAEYEEYVTHPQHTAFIERWRSRIESLRVYDVYDDTP